MTEAAISKLVERLEKAISRIEALEKGGSSSGGAGGGAAASGEGPSPAVTAWDALIAAHFPAMSDLAKKIDPSVAQSFGMLEDVAKNVRALIDHASVSKKPGDI